MLAMYVSHDEKTLSYMEHALYRIDKLKMVFAKYWPQNTNLDNGDDNETHFNIPKLHVTTHYVPLICLYGSAPGFDTFYLEAAHKFLVKNFFPMTNKLEGWERQMWIHNIRWVNIAAMRDVLLYRQTKAGSMATQRTNEGITLANRDCVKTKIEQSLEDKAILKALGYGPKQ